MQYLDFRKELSPFIWGCKYRQVILFSKKFLLFFVITFLFIQVMNIFRKDIFST